MRSRSALAFSGLFSPSDDVGARRAYEQDIESFFGAGRAFAFWKGRVALYAILKALGIGAGDEVIVPGYTCVMAIAPIIYLGATPVFADIEPSYFNMRPDEVSRKLSPRTRAIIIQHTYGYPAQIAELGSLAAGRGVTVIEDCCHAFAGRIDGRLLGTFGAAAYFSGQWNKPVSTGLGGIALVHDEALAARVRSVQTESPAPGWLASRLLAAELLAHNLLAYPIVMAHLTELFRTLSGAGLVLGSSNKSEHGTQMPAEYALRAGAVQATVGRGEMSRVKQNLAARRDTAARYAEALPALGYNTPEILPSWDPVLVRFPLRVANKAQALAAAHAHGVEIGSWFEGPLHTSEADHEAFGYQTGCYPVAERAAAEVINLPTHRRVTEADLQRTLSFVKTVCRPCRETRTIPGPRAESMNPVPETPSTPITETVGT